MAYKARASDEKKAVVKRFTKLMKDYPIIAAVNMENLPARQLQIMRAKLRGKVELIMTKRRLMRFAIESAAKEKEGLDKIIPYLKGMPALIFTRENPFSLFRTIKANKSKAPAKAGQTAPNDIIVPAGATPFAPGPVIGELGSFGIKSKVDGGKIHVVSDTTVAEEGKVISDKLAGLLTRLNILPMQVGLDITAVYENGTIFEKKTLDIDEDKFLADLNNAITWGLNLSCDIAFLTTQNRELLIGQAHTRAKALAISQGILASGIVGDVLARAQAQAACLHAKIQS